MAYQRKDAFYLRAKRAGYRSRAAYKLDELAERYRLFGTGDAVVDLGAWPGGWLQVAAQRVGPRGIVVGVDLQRIDPFPNLPQIVLIQGDIRDEATIERAAAACAGRVDLVLSDMAPKLSGIRERDNVNAMLLAQTAISVAGRMLRPGGTLVVKLFMSHELSSLLSDLRSRFNLLRTTRPDATRQRSAEIYAIATGSK